MPYCSDGGDISRQNISSDELGEWWSGRRGGPIVRYMSPLGLSDG